MKKTIALLAVTLLAGNASAEDFNVDEYCGLIGQYAGKVMEYRLNGGNFADLAKRTSDKDKRFIIIDAYKTHRWTSPAMVSKTIEEFRNHYTLQCYKSFG